MFDVKGTIPITPTSRNAASGAGMSQPSAGNVGMNTPAMNTRNMAAPQQPLLQGRIPVSQPGMGVNVPLERVVGQVLSFFFGSKKTVDEGEKEKRERNDFRKSEIFGDKKVNESERPETGGGDQ